MVRVVRHPVYRQAGLSFVYFIANAILAKKEPGPLGIIQEQHRIKLEQ